jgi:hypothetical protein
VVELPIGIALDFCYDSLELGPNPTVELSKSPRKSPRKKCGLIVGLITRKNPELIENPLARDLKSG